MKCYAAYARDLEVRNLGSSGGIFPVISMEYINHGGVVYSSIYDEDFNVVFKRVDSIKELPATFTSKYMQSNSLGIYKKLADDLKTGNKVLFCGTPCQVNALYKYLVTLKISTDNLLLVDFICHGVPSQKVFQLYMNEYYNHKLKSLNMRNKELGWNWGNYSWKMTFDDGGSKLIKQNEMPYMKGFLSNIILRPSCYKCKSKQAKHADITLGDFWGITDTDIKLDNRYGVSCVLLHTAKGENAFSNIETFLDVCKTNYNDILAGNPSLVSSSSRPYNRKEFFSKLDKCDNLELLTSKLTRRTAFSKVANKVYNKLELGKTSVKGLTSNSEERVMYKLKEQCSGCMACHSVCPKEAIIYKNDNEGFSYPVIMSQKCIHCGLCEKVCPQKYDI